jgi:hypothetical protein
MTTVIIKQNGDECPDSYVDPMFPDTNYGTEDTLRIQKITTVLLQQAYLKFPFRGIPKNVILNSVRLNLNISIGSAVMNLQGRFNLQDWDEDGITFNRKPTMGDILFISEPLSGAGWVTIDIPITDTVRKWIQGLIPNYGFTLFPDNGVGDLYGKFSSGEGPEEDRPYLEIDYTVIPAGAKAPDGPIPELPEEVKKKYAEIVKKHKGII